jgi:hypothetical protein
MKGLLVFIMGDDCTNSGATSGKHKALLVGPGIPEIFSPSDDTPTIEFEFEFDPQGHKLGYRMVAKPEWARMILERTVYDNENLVVRALAKPAGSPPGMFGGHYIMTSDSRFPFEGPLPVFDRFE